jgi:hypothetical protein
MAWIGKMMATFWFWAALFVFIMFVLVCYFFVSRRKHNTHSEPIKRISTGTPNEKKSLEWDISLDAILFGFDKETKAEKSQIILEKSRLLPIEDSRIFIDEQEIPCDGLFQIILTAKSKGVTRIIIDEKKSIPNKKWYSSIGGLYNRCQEAIREIPVVGKPLEKIAPDWYQKVKVVCSLSITDKKELSYNIILARSADNIELLGFNGNFNLG